MRAAKKVYGIVRDLLMHYLISLKMFVKYGTTDFFNDIDIEVNTSCNRRCAYCPNSKFDRGFSENEKLMEKEMYEKIINELAEVDFSGRISPIFYGEPLMRVDIVELMRYARERLPKATIKFTSNGDMLTVDKYLQLVDAGVDKFLITQHGKSMSPAMRSMFAFFKEYPEKKVNFTYAVFDDKTPLYNRGGLVAPKVVDYNPRCQRYNNPLIIDWAGNVVLCCHDYFSSVVFGNVKNQSLVEIWRSSFFAKIRKELKSGKYRFEMCRNCVGMGKDYNAIS